MKKVYSKPEIIFESFSLSTNIAGDCETITSEPSEGTCGYLLRGGDLLFVSDLTGCTTTAQDSTESDGSHNIGNDTVCYHVPAGYNNLFNS